jgi:hypothetical protein
MSHVKRMKGTRTPRIKNFTTEVCLSYGQLGVSRRCPRDCTVSSGVFLKGNTARAPKMALLRERQACFSKRRVEDAKILSVLRGYLFLLDFSLLTS